MTTTNAVPARERGILFSAPMVRALLAGTKTQTRRIAKDVKHPGWGNIYTPGALAREPKHTIDLACPFGQVGDRLWVREAWKAHTTFDHLPPRDIPDSHVWYMADDGYKAQSRYRHGMFMPRWASRITLEITGVRIERLTSISGTDALAEGVGQPVGTELAHGCVTDEWNRREYARLWDQINGAGAWDANPWVWCVSFAVLSTTTTTSKETADG